MTHEELQSRAKKTREVINAVMGRKPNDPEVERIFVEECAARGVCVVYVSPDERAPMLDVGDEEHNCRVTDGVYEPRDVQAISEAIHATRERFGLPKTTHYRRTARTGSIASAQAQIQKQVDES